MKEEINPAILGTAEIKIPVPWGHISGKTWGNTSGQRVLAIHGWMDNAGSFDKLFPLLKRSLYIVAIEMPGHGRSSHLPIGIPYHYIDFVSTIRRVVRYLGWNKFWYIGHSMGGSLGYIYNSLWPNEIEKFVSIDQIKTITDDVGETRLRFFDGLNAFLSLDKVQKLENAEPKGFSYEAVVQRLISYTKLCNYELSESGAKALCIRGTRQINEMEWAYNRDQRLMSSQILRFIHDDYLTMVKNIKAELFVALAEESLCANSDEVKEEARKTYEKYLKFKMVTLPGNHFLHLNNPHRLAQGINEFFN